MKPALRWQRTPASLATPKRRRKGRSGWSTPSPSLNVESDEEQQAAEEFAYHLQQGEPYLKWVHSMPLGPNPSTKTAANSDDYLNGKYVPEKFEGMFEAFSDELSMIREGFGALQRFGTVDGNSFSSYGPITSKQLIRKPSLQGHSGRGRTDCRRGTS